MLKIEITNDGDGLSSTRVFKEGKRTMLHELSAEELDKLSASIFGALRLIEITLQGK